MVLENGNCKALSLNFLCHSILILSKEYWPKEGPYYAFLANYILRENGEEI